MEIKLFGKSLFEAKKSTLDYVLNQASKSTSASKFLPDFHGFNGGNSNPLISEYIIMPDSVGNAVAVKTGKKEKPKTEIKITPKGVHELKLLNDESFELNANPEYVDKQLGDFKDKLSLISSEEYDMRRGVEEISSIIIRLENRKKYPEEKEFFEQFPYTTGSRIDNVIKLHDHLRLGKIAQFLADLPKEAVEVMKDYNKHTANICEKQAVFYIIANKKDFERSDKRRDPILLAQSPFGHFWQILGAWDEEMMFLEDL